MKRFTNHIACLSCLLALMVLLPGLAQAATTNSTATVITEDLKVTSDTNFTNDMEIKPTTGTLGIVQLSSGATATFQKNISGDAGLVIHGSGISTGAAATSKVHLNGTNTYTGGTYVYGGVLLVGSDSALGDKKGNVTLNGGTFRAKATFETDRAFTIGASAGNFEVANTSTLTVNGQVTGSGKLRMLQSGVLVLSNSNNRYSGGTDIHSGTVRLTAAGAAGTGVISFVTDKSHTSKPGTLDLSFEKDGTLANSIRISPDSDGSGVGGAIVKNKSTAVTLSGALVQSNSLEVKEGDLKVTNILETDSIDIAKGTNLTVGALSLAGGTDLKITNEGTFTYNSLMVSGKGNKITSSALPSTKGKNLSFVFDSNTAAGDTMLAVTGNSLDVTGSTVALAAGGELSKLKKGNTVTLIDKTSGAISNIGTVHTVEYGATTYTFTTAQGTIDPNSTVTPTDVPLTATLESKNNTGGKRGGAKAYLESAIAGLYTVYTANQFMGTVGIREAVRSSLEHDERNNVTASVAFRGTYSEVDTNSSIEGMTYNLAGAMTYKMRNNLGLSRVGLFGEGGWGDFDTKNSFKGRNIDGDADISYAGGGVLLRHDFPVGIYGEGTFRVGRMDNDFSSSDLGNGASYESSVLYYGGHLGLGYLHYFSEKHELDFFAKVFWTHTNSDSVTTDADESLHIDSADSIVSHLGARYSATLPWDLVFHVGAGWEHEFDGEQTGTLNDRAVNSPEMKGSSGVGEVGVRWTPFQTGFYLDLAAHGSAGQRDSIGGNLNLGYEF